MIKKGGSLRSMIGMVGLTEGSSDLKVIDAWVNKLEKCESEDVTSSSHCLSPAYKGADCNPNDGGSSDGDDNNDNDNEDEHDNGTEEYNGGVVEDESGGASDGSFIMKNSEHVIIVPGYGMAVSQAQHVVKEMSFCNSCFTNLYFSTQVVTT